MAKPPIVEGIDPDELKMFNFAVWSFKQGELVSAMIHLGDRLGLYKAMMGEGAITSSALAESTGTHERFVREWLLGQAAARLVVRHDDTTFELTALQAAVLADEDGSISFSAGAFRGGFSDEHVDALERSFKTGVGITYEEQGPGPAAGLARMTAPWTRHGLESHILSAVDGLIGQLEAGIDVADLGCGGGVLACRLAELYPNSTITGFDPSGTAIGLAADRAEAAGLGNVTFTKAFAEDLEPTPNYDFITTFDVLHDMPRPDRAIAAVKQTLRPDGAWLVKDIRSAGNWDHDKRNPMLALMYGFSVSSCLQSAMSEPGGMGLGTLGLHPTKAEELMRAGGFTQFTTHDVGDQSNLYYEIRH
ncbi:class I SAM-dependent methyltransferase [Acidimicrobiaceae bacterium AH-315-P05]|nr:class I SAM-dependent methyltransferase [Acidimicrobiaceae bacterium AH-315-P05]